MRKALAIFYSLVVEGFFFLWKLIKLIKPWEYKRFDGTDVKIALNSVSDAMKFFDKLSKREIPLTKQGAFEPGSVVLGESHFHSVMSQIFRVVSHGIDVFALQQALSQVTSNATMDVHGFNPEGLGDFRKDRAEEFDAARKALTQEINNQKKREVKRLHQIEKAASKVQEAVINGDVDSVTAALNYFSTVHSWHNSVDVRSLREGIRGMILYVTSLRSLNIPGLTELRESLESALKQTGDKLFVGYRNLFGTGLTVGHTFYLEPGVDTFDGKIDTKLIAQDLVREEAGRPALVGKMKKALEETPDTDKQRR